MNVSRSGYYKWLSRKGKLNNYQKNRESLKEQIKKVHKKHSTYGYRHIAQVIRNETGELFSDLRNMPISISRMLLMDFFYLFF